MNNTVTVRELATKTNKNGDGHGTAPQGDSMEQQPKPETMEEHVPAPAEPVSPSKPGRRPWVWALTGAVVVAASAAGVAYYLHCLSFESTDDAFIEGHVVPVSSRVPGHVAKVCIEDNQLVQKGDLLVELDSADFQTRLAAAEAATKAAQATCAARTSAIGAATAGLEQAKADLVAAEARELQANAHFRRIESLVPQRAAPQDTLDQVKALAHVAVADVTASRERIKVQQSAVEQAKAAAEAAESAVHQAEAELNQAKLNFSYTKIYASIAGRITRKSIEVGAFVQVGQPLLAIVDPDVWIVANFKETQLAKMRPGQPAIVIVDTHPDVKFAGHIDSIQLGSGARFSLMPPENATGNYVKVVQRVPVKIVFDDLQQIEHYHIGPGMSVVPTVRINESPCTVVTAAR